MVSGASVSDNMNHAARAVTEAAAGGASLVLLPEYWSSMGLHDADKVKHAETPGDGLLQNFLSRTAEEHKIWLVGGTIPLSVPGTKRAFNTTLVYNPSGGRMARYDKIHLFDFTGTDESHEESALLIPGKDVAFFETQGGRVGLSICYDLRFPELYRALGPCSLIVVPAAFTYATGRAHWEVLLRARAIENQCYVLAAAQAGMHPSGKRTWGHSMLIDPWGEICANLTEGEGILMGMVDSERLAHVRRNLPALDHRRM